MKRPPSRAAAFRQALRQWQATATTSTPAPAALVKLAVAALVEAEGATARVRAMTVARCRAAIGAIAAGAPGDAARVLETAIAEAERGDQ